MNCTCTNQIPPIYKGDTATLTLSVMQPDGSYMNFNGKTVKFIIKKTKEKADTEAIVLKTIEPEEDITELPISLTTAETNVAEGTYWYGVRVIVDGYQTTEGEGQVDIVQGPFYGE